MSKTNLPIEERAVRIAQMDTDGNDIADFAVDIAALQQAVAGKVVFDGELLIDSHGSPYLSQTEYNRLLALPHNKYLMKSNKEGTFNNFIAYVVVAAYGNPQNNKHSVQIFMINWTDTNLSVYYKTYNTDSTYDGDFVSKSYLSTYSSGNSSWDTTPTQDSTKPVTSGGIYSAIAALNLGSKLYLHRIAGTDDGNVYDVSVISNEPTPYTSAFYLGSNTVLCAGSLINGKAIIGYDMDTGFIYLYKVGDTGISFIPQSFGGTMVDTVTAL